jgi:hypothetical protein
MKRLAILALILSLPLAATTYTWDSAVDGNWADQNNWSPSTGYPNSPADEAEFRELDLTNVTVTITVPNAVTVGVIRAENFSNTFALTGGKIVMTNSTTTNAVISTYFDSKYHQARTYALDIASQMEFLQDTVLEVDLWSHFGGKVRQTGAISGMGHVQLFNAGHTGSGVYVLDEGGVSTFAGVFETVSGAFELRSDAMANAREIRVSGGSFSVFGSQSAKVRFAKTGGSCPGGGVGTSTGEWIVETNITYTVWTTRTMSGTVRGHGKVTTGGNNWLQIRGQVHPGLSIGVLELADGGNSHLDVAGGVNPPMELHVEIDGAGGVAGVDHDQLVVTDLESDLNLSNIAVSVSGIASGSYVTNWIVTAGGPNGLTNEFRSVEHTNGLYTVATVYDYGNKRAGVIVIPEPAVALAGVFALLLVARRR